MKRRYNIRIVIQDLLIMIMGICITGCMEEDRPETFYEEEELLISAFLRRHPGDYSMLSRVLELTGIEAVLNAYGHYTFFAPDNDAFEHFLSAHNKTSVEDFELDYLQTLIRYHLLNTEIGTSYMPNGVFTDTTFTGDKLVFTFNQGGINNISVNSEATIIEGDIYVANGLIHRLDNVLTPVIKPVYEYLRDDGGHSVFSQALELCGFDDTLQTITIPVGHDKFIRTQFTVFAETDEVFAREGIQSVEDLVARFSGSGDPEDPENGLNRFMAYHCIPGFYYLNNLNSFNYPTLCPQSHINISVGDDILINRHDVVVNGSKEEWFIKLIKDESNKVVKNGVFHAIDRVLEPWEPDPASLMFSFTDYQGIVVGETYTEDELKDVWGISTENTGLVYKYSILDEDASYLVTTSGRTGWSVEFSLPSIIKGSYNLYLSWVSNNDRSDFAQIFWDGQRINDNYSFHRKRRPAGGGPWEHDYRVEDYIGTVVLSETEEHTLRFLNLAEAYVLYETGGYGGVGCFDYIMFRPN